MPQKVAITVSNDVVTDQRVIRMVGLLSDEGYQVTIVGRYLGNEIDRPLPASEIRLFKMLFRKGFLFYKFLNIRILFFLLLRHFDLIISVDLDTLLAGVLAAKIKNERIIYDAHEYFTGAPELLNRPTIRNIWKRIEIFSMKRIKHMITVNNSIANLFETEYDIKPTVVRNIGDYKGNKVCSKDELGISDEHLLLIIQGTGINKDRGGIESIKAVEKANMIITESDESDNRLIHLLIIGSGDEIPSMRSYVYNHKLFDYITFLAPMDWNSLLEYTRMADVGLSLDSPVSINYKFSLPNKIFDYLNSGLAIICTRLPELTNIVEQDQCGIIVDNNSLSELIPAIEKLNTNRGLLKVTKENSIKASTKYLWEIEKLQLKSVIDEVLQNNLDLQ